MSYLICEECGKQHKLDEGKSSFNFEKCECGGKLKYSPFIKEDPHIKPVKNSSKSKFNGVIIGFIFLFSSLTLSIVALFGTNISSINTSNISSSVLDIFTIIAVILTVASGSISSYISGGGKYLESAINGGLVGVILGLMLGMIGGGFILLTGVLVFGFLSMIGGLFGSFIKKNIRIRIKL